jgi:hypothetical protein
MEEPFRHSATEIFYPAFSFADVSGVSADDDAAVGTIEEAGSLFETVF